MTGFQFYGPADMATAYPSYQPALKWRGGDLQTLRNTLRGPALSLDSTGERVYFTVSSNQTLAAAWHLPEGGADDTRLPIIMVHGLTGCEGSTVISSAAAHFLAQGYAVLRLNLRGAGPSAATSFGPYHGGLTDDLRAVITQFCQQQGIDQVYLYGISLGGNMVLKYLGEEGSNAPVRAAVTVCAPLDLAGVQKRLQEFRNRVYRNFLLKQMKDEARRSADFHPAERIAAALAAPDIYTYDDIYVAPTHGFANADDYYARNSSGDYLGRIAVPSLLIHAATDPWIPAADYLRRTWAAPLQMLMADDGGHVGFHASDSPIPWHDRCAAIFLNDT